LRQRCTRAELAVCRGENEFEISHASREAQVRKRAVLNREAQARKRAALNREAQARKRAALNNDGQLTLFFSSRF
jgi:hypothetical protein